MTDTNAVSTAGQAHEHGTSCVHEHVDRTLIATGNMPDNTPVQPLQAIGSKDDKKESSKTYLEQTKLLTTLASTFIVAPAILFKEMANLSIGWVVTMEVSFIFSVIFGYVVAGSLAGTQYEGKYNIYRRAAMWGSLTQLGLYLIGLGILVSLFLQQGAAKGKTTAINKRDTVYVLMKDTVLVRVIPVPQPATVPLVPAKKDTIN
ncbi:hypothetical protein HNQ91_001171 [Filimonas zeae]|uniref:Uncharacterized protein n=1 Tax=Filimonas zeae TaxID=1737353 RepID=A0A917MSR7_9BACT|nr:hypothetical protein [Filimonas zeae]MDR6338149.1 hypothetical protein [Filimonas zeae]GGH61964.1 hypothetical protein GCM10011379_11450 [Filimonas zeae]